MSDVFSQVSGEIASIRAKDARLGRTLEMLNKQLFALKQLVDPLVADTTASVSAASAPTTPGGFSVAFTGTTVRFSWASVDGAASYEVRRGDDWDTATLEFRTVNVGADIDPVLIGDYTFLLKAIDIDGNYSDDPAEVSFSIPLILPVVITSIVIDNTVLLTWSSPTTVFNITRFDVYRDDVLFGFSRGNFSSIFEAVAGDYTYKIIAVDLAGNESSPAQVTLSLNQPPDFVLEDSHTSTLNGTLSSMVLETSPEPDKIVGPMDTTRTWEEHFTDNSWTTIQDQIDAGYPYYGQPSKTSGTPNGYYEEVIDWGTLFAATIATLTYNYNQVHSGHDVAVVVKMAFSTDNVTYTAFTSGAVQLATNMRYLKFRLELTGADDNALIEIFNIALTIQVKREDDGGEVDAVSTDPSGTSVSFNKSFKDIDKITATVKATTQYTVVVDFVDVANPTGFSVYVFDAAGVRASKKVEWHARGIV